MSWCGRQMGKQSVSLKCAKDSGKLQHRVLWKHSPQTGIPAQSLRSLAFSGVWKDEQLVKQEEVREGKSFPDRKGGLVKAELCSHRVWGGNKAIHCCVAPSAGEMDREAGEARSQESGRTTCSLDALPGLSSMLL